MIEITTQEPLSTGSHRAIYAHPFDENKILKVTDFDTLRHRRRHSKWTKRLRPLSTFNETNKELKALRLWQKKYGDAIFAHIPRFYGMVETSKGSAMEFDFIHNERKVLTLGQYIRENGKTDAIRHALDDLGSFIEKYHLIIRDFSLNNVAVKMMDGKPILYIIDGYGVSELIPVSLVPCIAKKKAMRRFKRLYDYFQSM